MKKRGFKVSVITVVYNGAETIEQAIQSVINQTYRNIEYILIDGGSTDRTQKIVKNYINHINLYISEPDDGIYDAMNKGESYASGDIIAFLNSDDWYESDAIQKVIEYFQENEVDMVIGSASVVHDNLVITTRKCNICDIKFGTPCCHQAVFAKKSLFNKIGNFNTKYRICADYDWIYRAYINKSKIKCVSDIFVNYRDGGMSAKESERLWDETVEISLINARRCNDKALEQQITQSYQNSKEKVREMKQCFSICEKRENLLTDLLGRGNSYYIWGTGNYGKKCYKLFQFADIVIKGFIDNNIKQKVLYGYPVIEPQQIQNNSSICIATIAFEEEILEQIKEMGIWNKYICFSKLITAIIGQVNDNR